MSTPTGSYPQIEALFADGGDITIGPIGPMPCVATAADENGTLAMLQRREGESLPALLLRLDRAIAHYWEHGEVTDEVNG